MSRLILVSNLTALDAAALSTSSAKYELDLARGMSGYVDSVEVLSQKAKENESADNISLYSCPSADSLRDFAAIGAQAEKLLEKDGEKAVILFFGYNPRLMKTLLKLRSRAKLASVVYDTHKGAAQGKSALKKAAIDFFFSPGLRMINDLDGVVLFRREAADALRLRVPRCVVLPSVDVGEIADFAPTGNEKLRFLYAGTLCDYNATRETIDAFSKDALGDAHLAVFGDGPLAGYAAAAAERAPNITFGGRVTTAELEKEIAAADVLLNLRDTSNEVMKYAFPSKLVEYMKYGKAVMSTRVSDAPSFEDAVFLAPDSSTDSIASLAAYICEHRGEISKKVEGSRSYLKENHDRRTINDRLYTFLFKEI